jgi:hypothetical protein
MIACTIYALQEERHNLIIILWAINPVSTSAGKYSCPSSILLFRGFFFRKADEILIQNLNQLIGMGHTV